MSQNRAPADFSRVVARCIPALTRVPFLSSGRSNQSTIASQSNLSTGSVSPVKRSTSIVGLSHSRHHKKKQPLHVLNIAAPVTRIRWRPPEGASSDNIAVATSSIYGASNAGGNGAVGLWSVFRPFMPISVCEGHVEGAVTDFAFVRKQQVDGSSRPRSIDGLGDAAYSVDCGKMSYSRVGDPSGAEEEKEPSDAAPEGNALQTCIISVGRDGQCLLQNFALGECPILEVPRAPFSLGLMSPFQPGFGSLQVMAVHQSVDKVTQPPNISSKLVFSITDQGEAQDLSKTRRPGTVDVAPELTHLSRFSELYVTTKGNGLDTKAGLCRHNANVAEGLNQKAIMQMWKTLATILDGSGLDGLPTSASESHSNPMSYLLNQTLLSLLQQRAESGDVQTCVVLCELMGVVVNSGGAAKSMIPNLDIALIREWYLAYIDL